jgi:peptidoglycan/LPS O-acetylase OafA/YrhL
MSTGTIAVKTSEAIAAEPLVVSGTMRFYRPELDGLRFFAFLAVLLHHGPQGRHLLWFICSAGGFGLSMFFLLSAYLITELLLREKDKTDTVAWGLFFVRRALRIWPLYYAVIVTAIIIARIPPHAYCVSRTSVVVMTFFVANWTKLAPSLGVLVGALWSISIEEQFYLIWPPIIKFGGERLAFIASLVFIVFAAVWLWVFSPKGWLLWYDTPVQFLFFAAGAIIALLTRGRTTDDVNGMTRGGLLVAGVLLLLLTAHFGYVGTEFVPGVTRQSLYIKYAGGLAGCAAIFWAALGISNMPRAFIYLGKISYGLYVFHLGMLQLSLWITSPLGLAPQSAVRMFIVDSVALLLSMFFAHFSYQYFERPFMKLKERFAVIQSRPA